MFGFSCLTNCLACIFAAPVMRVFFPFRSRAFARAVFRGTQHIKQPNTDSDAIKFCIAHQRKDLPLYTFFLFILLAFFFVPYNRNFSRLNISTNHFYSRNAPKTNIIHCIACITCDCEHERR